MSGSGAASYVWRGAFSNTEVNGLHAQAFETKVYSDEDWDWRRLTDRHSLGWVTARVDEMLVGFVNIAWDGYVHAWLQDLMVEVAARKKGVGQRLVAEGAEGARSAGCEWLHVDFEPALERFYVKKCGFRPTTAGLMQL
jgi:GNAT superfamily N-acetyltransferase